MKKNIIVQVSIVFIAVFIFTGCTPMDSKMTGTSAATAMTIGNANNIQVIENPVMMFHDIVVSETPEGAELEGKMHVKSRAKYVPGHIDIAVVDKKTGDTVSILSTDFDHRIAKHGHRNLKHANNFASRIPDIDPEAVTIYVAYHHSNVDRFSQIDCGANVAVASINEKAGVVKRLP